MNTKYKKHKKHISYFRQFLSGEKVMEIDRRIKEILMKYRKRGELVISVWVLCKELGLSPQDYPRLLDYLEAKYMKYLMEGYFPHRTLLLNPSINRRSVKKYGTWRLIPVRYLKAVEGTKWARSAIWLIATELAEKIP